MEEKQILQVVLIAESFDKSFDPITKNIPKALINVVNSPLIDYNLDWLQRNHVDETIIYCRAQPYADVIREHTRHASNWPSMKVTVIASEDCDALGDVLRDLYSKTILRPNFLLMYGDIVANINLKDILKKHKDIMEHDKSAIMTCVYLPTPSDFTTDANNADHVTLMTSAGRHNKILLHQRCRKLAKTNFQTDTILRYGAVSLLPNHADPCIAVCSEIVPSLFCDNFDYRSRDNLINGVVEQEELLGYSIYAHVVNDGYAKRVSSFNAYQAVSEDVISRRGFPEVPEVSLTSHRVRYSYDSFNSNYWECSAKFQKGNLKMGNVVGAGCMVGENTRILNTVLGDHCVIQNNVYMKNAYIQSNTEIYTGCKLEQCYVGSGVTLYQNVVLQPGCVVGPGVKLGPDITVAPCTKLGAKSPMLFDLFRDPKKSIPDPDPLVCGAKGSAYVYPTLDESSEDLSVPVWGKVINSAVMSSDEDDNSDYDEDQVDSHVIRDEDEEREFEFKQEVNDSLVNAYLENSMSDKVVLEINASRHAYNVSMEHVLTTVVKGVISISHHESINSNNAKLWPVVKKSLGQFSDVLRNYVKRPRDQLIVLNSIEEMSSDDQYITLAQGVIHELNQELEILDDDIIIEWYRGGGAKTETFDKLSKHINKMIEWLEEDSDEESEED